MTSTIEIYVATDHGKRTNCIYYLPDTEDIPTTVKKLREEGFESVPAVHEPPPVQVTVKMSFGSFVPEGGETQSPETHHEQFYLPGADPRQDQSRPSGYGGETIATPPSLGLRVITGGISRFSRRRFRDGLPLAARRGTAVGGLRW